MDRKKDIFDYLHPFTKRLKPVIDFARKHPFLSLIIVACLFLLTFLLTAIIRVVVITSLIFIGGFSKVYQRYTTIPIGVELVMFSAVVAGFVYGPFIGAFVGISSFLLATFLSLRYNPMYVVISLIIYTLAGMFAQSFSSVTIAGIVFTIIFTIVLSFLSLVTFMSRVDRVIMFAISTLLWDLWVFIALAPKIVGLLI